MKIDEWHEARLKNNPAYARAVAEGAIAEEMADRAVALRISAGLSQRELAARARTTQATISQLETGGGNPTLETVDRIFAALEAAQPQVSPFYLSAKTAQTFLAGNNSASGSGTASFGWSSSAMASIEVEPLIIPPGFARGINRSINDFSIPYAA